MMIRSVAFLACLATLLTFFHVGIAIQANPSRQESREEFNNNRNNVRLNNRNSGSGMVPSAPVPTFDFPKDTTGATGQTGATGATGQTGATGLTGLEDLDQGSNK